MLASTAEDVGEALERLGEAAFEYKVDGARIQVHKAGDEVRVFTRQLQDVTDRVPEVVAWARALGPRELVVEGRGRRPARRTAGPSRSRSRCAASAESKTSPRARRAAALSSFFFDCLYAPGRGLAHRAALRGARGSAGRAVVPAASLLPRLVTSDADEAQRFLEPVARRRPRGPHGQVARRALRRGPSRLPLAEAQVGADPRPRGPRRGVGQRPAQGLALEPAPGRARPGERPAS